MSMRATEPTLFCFSTNILVNLSTFEYSGGRHPGTVRTVRFVSWFWAWGERDGLGEGYMQTYDLDGVYKTYLYSKMSKVRSVLLFLPVVQIMKLKKNHPQIQIMTKKQLSNSEFFQKLHKVIVFAFKYSGSSWPGVLRTLLFFHSYYNAGHCPWRIYDSI